MFYLIMREGDARRWWNADAEGWGSRQGATRYHVMDLRFTRVPDGGRWVGPCDAAELGSV